MIDKQKKRKSNDRDNKNDLKNKKLCDKETKDKPIEVENVGVNHEELLNVAEVQSSKDVVQIKLKRYTLVNDKVLSQSFSCLHFIGIYFLCSNFLNIYYLLDVSRSRSLYP